MTWKYTEYRYNCILFCRADPNKRNVAIKSFPIKGKFSIDEELHYPDKYFRELRLSDVIPAIPYYRDMSEEQKQLLRDAIVQLALEMIP